MAFYESTINTVKCQMIGDSRIWLGFRLIFFLLSIAQVRRSLKIRGRRKEKEKLPSGITADYSANFFAHLDLDRDVERDRGVEEVMADANATIDNGDHVVSINVSHSDSSETSLQSVGVSKVRLKGTIRRG